MSHPLAKVKRTLRKSNEFKVKKLRRFQLQLFKLVQQSLVKQNFKYAQKCNIHFVQKKQKYKHKSVNKFDLNEVDCQYFTHENFVVTSPELKEPNKLEVKPSDLRVPQTVFKKKPASKPRLNKSEIELLHAEKILPFQMSIMPDWDAMDLIEKEGMCNFIKSWKLRISQKFEHLNDKQKSMCELSINEAKLLGKGVFKFEAEQLFLKRVQLEIWQANTDQSALMARPNTRLIIKGFTQFLQVFDILKELKACRHEVGVTSLRENAWKSKSYWKGMSKCLGELLKAAMITTVYVHENVKVKNSIGKPPIYYLESRDSHGLVTVETAYEYTYLCLNMIKKEIGRQHKLTESIETQNELSKLKCFKLMLNCLIQMIKIAAVMRDNLTMKLFNHVSPEANKPTDLDVFAHQIAQQCKLVKDFVMEIIFLSF